jgi:quercetin dioxygenase-like cupin family protein
MIRCVRIWTGEDGNSSFEEGTLKLAPGARGDLLSGKVAAQSISFQETASGGTFAWHTAPTRQFVITLAGNLDFETRHGEHFAIRPGDVLLAEDTAGSGHCWRLTDEQPWRRIYVVLDPGAPVAFEAGARARGTATAAN